MIVCGCDCLWDVWIGELLDLQTEDVFVLKTCTAVHMQLQCEVCVLSHDCMAHHLK